MGIVREGGVYGGDDGVGGCNVKVSWFNDV